VLGTRRYLTGTPTSALLHFFRGQNPAASPAALIRVTPWLPTAAGNLWRLRYESASRPYSQGTNCFLTIVTLMLAIAPLWLILAANTSAQTSNDVSNSATTTSPAPAPADWTQFLRDNMQRWNPYETILGINNVATLGLKWTYRTNSGLIELSSPAVANGVVYVSSWVNNLYALNASTGAKLWSFATGAQVFSSPAVVNGAVYFGSDDHNVYALNASTGAKLWSFATGLDVSSSPTVANGVVYIGSDDNNVYALNASTGAKLWSFATEDPVESSPAVANGVVYVSSFDDNLYALNASTGRKLWSYTTDDPVESSPAVANGVVYVSSSYGGTVYALNAGTGVKLWSFAAGGLMESSPAVANGVVYVSSSYGTVYALNASTGVKLWSFATGALLQSSPAVANGVVYLGSFDASSGSQDGYMYALNASTGAKLWSYPTGPIITPSPAIVDGVVYILAGDAVYAFGLGLKADLFLRIRPTLTTVHQGDLITYAFPVWNLGPDVADQEVLKTQVPAGTTFDYIRISGTPGLGTCTTPPYQGTGQIVCHENAAMAPNTTWTVRLTVKVTGAPGTVITENAATMADTPDPNLANNTATVSLTVQ
jgi:outer membrane protein assembly factor BamB